MAIVDAVDDADLLQHSARRSRGPAAGHRRLGHRASACRANFAARRARGNAACTLPAVSGRAAVVSGSCSLATNAQVRHFRAGGSAALPDRSARARGEDEMVRQGAAPGLRARLRRRPCWSTPPPRPQAVQGGAGATRRRARRRAGRASARRASRGAGRARRAPARRRGRRDLGRRACRRSACRAAAHRRADRSRRAVAATQSPAARRGAAPGAEVGQLRQHRFLHQGVRALAMSDEHALARRDLPCRRSRCSSAATCTPRRQHQRAPATTAS